MGVWALHTFFQRRQRCVFERWTKRAATYHLEAKIRKEYNAKLPNVYQILENSGLQKQCDKLNDTLKALQKEKCPHDRVDKEINTLDEKLKESSKAILEQLNALEQYANNNINKLSKQASGADQHLSALDYKITENIMPDIAHISEAQVDFAKTSEVQAMMRDILLIWNSIKQLDAAKADKKDVDAFALESSNREKRAAQRFEDLESESATRVSEGVMGMHEKLQELGSRVEENSRAFRHWQQMWESLAGFVEDLVAKIAEIQGFDPSRLPAGAGPGNGKRANTPSRSVPGAGGPNLPPTRPPPMAPEDDGGGPAISSARGPGESVDTMERWISSARNIVDGAIEGAQVQAQSRRTPNRPRPASANAARSAAAPREDAAPALHVSGMNAAGPPQGHIAGQWRNSSTGSLRNGGRTPTGRMASAGGFSAARIPEK